MYIGCMLAPECMALNGVPVLRIFVYKFNQCISVYVYPLTGRGLGLFNGIYWTFVIRIGEFKAVQLALDTSSVQAVQQAVK